MRLTLIMIKVFLLVIIQYFLKRKTMKIIGILDIYFKLMISDIKSVHMSQELKFTAFPRFYLSVLQLLSLRTQSALK